MTRTTAAILLMLLLSDVHAHPHLDPVGIWWGSQTLHDAGGLIAAAAGLLFWTACSVVQVLRERRHSRSTRHTGAPEDQSGIWT